jgi:hypothetical protein
MAARDDNRARRASKAPRRGGEKGLAPCAALGHEGERFDAGRTCMRRALLAILVAAIALAGHAAAAQDEIARELQRKAKAKDLDEGFCERAAERLERMGQQHVRARLNEMLSRNDSEPYSMLFVTDEPPTVPKTCFYFEFTPATMKGGKKCRGSAIYGCLVGRDCRTRTDQQICEVRPGIWD